MRIDFRILHRKSQLGEARAHQSARLLLDFRFFEYILYVPDFFYLPFIVERLLKLLLVRLMAQLVPLVHSSLETTFLHERDDNNVSNYSSPLKEATTSFVRHSIAMNDVHCYDNMLFPLNQAETVERRIDIHSI